MRGRHRSQFSRATLLEQQAVAQEYEIYSGRDPTTPPPAVSDSQLFF